MPDGGDPGWGWGWGWGWGLRLQLVKLGKSPSGVVDLLQDGLAPALVLGQVQDGCPVGVGVEQAGELPVGRCDHLAEPAPLGKMRPAVARAVHLKQSSADPRPGAEASAPPLTPRWTVQAD